MITEARNKYTNQQALIDFVKRARVGDVFIYYRGDSLAAQRDLELIRTAETIYSFACDGLLYLFQRRLGPSNFEYRAVKAGRMHPDHIPHR